MDEVEAIVYNTALGWVGAMEHLWRCERNLLRFPGISNSGTSSDSCKTMGLKCA